MRHLSFCLALSLVGLLFASEFALDDPFDVAHMRNLARVKHLLLQELQISEAVPISPENVEKAKRSFGETDLGFSFFNEEDAYEYVALIGHSAGNTSTMVSFEFGNQVLKQRIESAKLIFFLKTAQSPSTRDALLTVTDQNGDSLARVDLPVPNSPTKRFTVPLNRDALERTISAAAADHYFSLSISAKANEWDDLLMVKGRRGHEAHMGVIIELQFPSQKLLAKRRIKRRIKVAEGGTAMRTKCAPNEKTCCPHIKPFGWHEMGPQFDRIIAPERFQSVVCRGTCDNYIHKEFKHTIERQEIINHVKKTCCHPSEYEPQSVMFVNDEGDVVIANVDSFYVTRCNCD